MEDLGGGAAAGLATAAGPEEAAGTPDWVAQFRCVWMIAPFDFSDRLSNHVMKRGYYNQGVFRHLLQLYMCVRPRYAVEVTFSSG